jgi:fructokinase
MDIIFKNGQPQAAKAGGSVLNSAVSIGRMGLPVSFISEYGNDAVGDLIDDFLKSNGVDPSNVYRHKDGSTSLALAFLNEKNDASYTFYKQFLKKGSISHSRSLQRTILYNAVPFTQYGPRLGLNSKPL